MPYTLVYIEIKPENIEAFKKISLYNCENSRREAGCVSFDLLQNAAEPEKFTLCEHFRDKAAVDAHKTTEHYKKWADEVAEYMKKPREKTVYEFVGEPKK